MMNGLDVTFTTDNVGNALWLMLLGMIGIFVVMTVIMLVVVVLMQRRKKKHA